MIFFLRAKHWQLFILFFGIPMMFELLMLFNLLTNMMHNPDPASAFNSFKFFSVIMFFCTGTLFGWFWAVATWLQKLVPANVKMKVGKFKVFFFIPLVYLICICFFVFSVMPGFATGNVNNIAPFAFMFAIIFPVHLFSMFCIFYCLYFVAKTIKTVELQREVSFADFAGEFFLSWFFFVGVWILQPRINKLADQLTEQPAEEA